MTDPNSGDWRNTFCGRDDELSALGRLYAEVAAGAGPKVCVVLGDRGMGKTRLVQEFYRRLCQQHDPHHYWPDATLFAGNNIRVAPEFDDPVTKSHYAGFTLDDRPMPFLWWGLRLADPAGRNAAVGSLAAHRSTLDLHLIPALFGRNRSRLARSLQQSVREHAAQLGKKAVLDLVKATPVLGSIATLVDWSFEVTERLGLTTLDAIRARSGEQKELASTLAELNQERANGLLERTLDDLAAVLAPRDGLTALPTVVFCDDAQFAGMGVDEGAMRLLEALWERAHLGGWPLLLVLTHWAVDWHQRVDEGSARDPGGRWPHIAGGFSRAARSPQFGQVLELGAEPELVQLIRRGLPHLPGMDEQLLLSKADGNPQLLVELVSLVRRSPAWRLAPDACLTPYARKQIESQSSKLVDLIRERLESDATPEHVRQGVALSSVQGLRFLCALTHEAATALHLRGSGEGLALAEHPHRLVVDVSTGVAGFVQRAYLEAAESLVGRHLGDPILVRGALLQAAVSIRADAARWAGLAPAEKTAALDVLVGLGENDPDSAVRLHAARALLDLTREALATQLGADYARAAELASRFRRGLAQRWALSAFRSVELGPVCEALSAWHGSAAVYDFSFAVLSRARQALQEQPDADQQYEVAVWAVNSGQSAQELGRWSEAEEMFRDGLDIFRLLAERGTPEANANYQALLVRLGLTLEAQGKFREAEALYRRSLRASREDAAAQESLEARSSVSIALANLGQILQAQERWSEADAHYREALVTFREVAEVRGTPRARLNLSSILKHAGQTAQDLNRWDEAEAHFRESLELSRVLADQLGTPKARSNLSSSLSTLGQILQDLGRWPEAEVLYREGLAVCQALADQVDTPAYRRALAFSFCNVGQAVQALGRWEEAEAMYREGLRTCCAVAEQVGTPAAWRDVWLVHINIARSAQAHGRLAWAEQLFLECVRVSRAIAEHTGEVNAQLELALSLDNSGKLAHQQGRWDDAQALYQQSLDLRRERAKHQGSPRAWRDVAMSLDCLSRLAKDKGHWKEAEGLMQEHLSITRGLAKQLGTPQAQRDLAVALENAGRAAQALHQLEKASALFREGLDTIRELATQANTPLSRRDLAVSLMGVGEIAQGLGRLDESTVMCAEAVQLFQELAEQLGTAAARDDLGCALWTQATVHRDFGDREAFCAVALEAWRELRAATADVESAAAMRRLEFIERQLRECGCEGVSGQ